MGFWAALDEIYPQTVHQRCWMHKTVNVLNYLPRSVQPKAKGAIQAIWMADTRANAYRAFDLFLARRVFGGIGRLGACSGPRARQRAPPIASNRVSKIVVASESGPLTLRLKGASLCGRVQS